jgi:hypothetical protein
MQMECGKYRPLLRVSSLTLFVALAGCTVLQPNAPSKFEVFFASGSSELSPSTKEIVDQAAAAIKAQHPNAVIIGAGGSAKGVALSDPRFDVVRAALLADGVSPSLIVQANLPIEKIKGAGIAELRVEIRLVQD